MSAEVSIGTDARLTPHLLRAVILGEVHARPFTAIETPRRILHFGFDTTGEAAKADRAALADFCARRNLEPLQGSAKHQRVSFGGATLRWEQHSEFTTYTWELPSDDVTPFHPGASSMGGPMGDVPQPGPLLVALDLHLLPEAKDKKIKIENLFDRASLAVAENSDGTALFATDFQADPSGFVRILLLDRGLGPERAGAVVQRVIETETYRTLALLGLPEAQRLSPSIARIEKRLAEVTEEMRRAHQLIDNQRLLDELTALAAELEDELPAPRHVKQPSLRAIAPVAHRPHLRPVVHPVAVLRHVRVQLHLLGQGRAPLRAGRNLDAEVLAHGDPGRDAAVAEHQAFGLDARARRQLASMRNSSGHAAHCGRQRGAGGQRLSMPPKSVSPFFHAMRSATSCGKSASQRRDQSACSPM